MKKSCMPFLRRTACLLLTLSLLILPAAAENLLIMPAPSAADPWGLTMTLRDSSSTGATIVLTQSGGDASLFTHPRDELFTGADYWLEVQKNDGWEPVEMIPENLAWIAIAYRISPNDSQELPVSWETIYGELPAGTYRIGKGVSYRSYQDHEDGILPENRTYYAEFTISPDQTAAWSNPFTDVKRSDDFYAAVEYVYESGLMKGKTETVFDPAGTTTRGQIVTVLWRLENTPVVNYILPFSDVEEELYYTEAIRWAAAEHIVEGYDDSTFRPDAPISRQQLTAILWRYATYTGVDVSVGEDTNILSYHDAFDVSEYAIPAMQWACGAGVMCGHQEGRLRPADPAIRSDTAQMLTNFLRRK